MKHKNGVKCLFLVTYKNRNLKINDNSFFEGDLFEGLTDILQVCMLEDERAVIYYLDVIRRQIRRNNVAIPEAS